MTILGSWGLTWSEIGQVTIVLWLMPFVIMLLLVGASTDGNGDAIPLYRRPWRKHVLPLPLVGIFVADIILRMPLTPFNWLGYGLILLVVYFSGFFIYKIMMALEERTEHNLENEELLSER